MEIFNIGPLEFIIILVLMFIILGPKEMILTAYRIGQWVRKITHSPMWREIIGYSAEIRELPKKVMDETGLQETLAEIKQTTKETAAELNAQIQDANNQIKEAAQAAQVTDLEHVRLENQIAESVPALPSLTNPSAEVVPPIESGTPEVPTLLATAPKAGVPEAGEAAQPTVLETAAQGAIAAPEAVEEAPVVKKTRRKKVTPESAQPEPPQEASPEPEPAPKRTRARKTTPKPVEIPVDEAPQEEAALHIESAPHIEGAPQVEAAPEVAAHAAVESGPMVEPPAGEAAMLQSTDILQVTPPDGVAPLNGNGLASKAHEPSGSLDAGGALEANGPLEAFGEEKPARKPRKPRAPKAKVTPPNGGAPAEGAQTETGPDEVGAAQIFSTEPSQDNDAA